MALALNFSDDSKVFPFAVYYHKSRRLKPDHDPMLPLHVPIMQFHTSSLLLP